MLNCVIIFMLNVQCFITPKFQLKIYYIHVNFVLSVIQKHQALLALFQLLVCQPSTEQYLPISYIDVGHRIPLFPPAPVLYVQ